MPTQVITAPDLTLAPGESPAVTLSYSTVDPELAPAAGLSALVHFDSSELTFSEATDVLGFGGQPLAARAEATDEDDGDPSTDTVIPVVFVDFNNIPANWPFAEVDSQPVDIATLNFTPSGDFDGSNVNITLGATQTGFDGAEGDLLDSVSLVVDDPNVPEQVIDLSSASSDTADFGVSISYSTVDVEEAPAAGVSFLIHFDSSALSFVDVTDLFAFGNQPLAARAEAADESDGDPNTDTVIPFVFVDFNNIPANWPFAEADGQPVDLGTINFAAAGGFDPLTDETTVNATLAAVQTGFDNAEGQLLDSQVLPGNQPPIVVEEIDDVVVDEDAEPLIIDLAPVFEDIETDDANLTFAVEGVDDTLFSAAIDGTNLTLTFVENAFGSADPVTVTATDEGGLSVSDSFSLTVNSVNDLPEFENLPGAASVTENFVAAGDVVFTVEADDVETADADLTFTIASGNAGGAFAIDNAGVVTVATPDAIDFETQTSFDLVVEVADTDGGTATETLTIAVNNDPGDDIPVGPDGNGVFDALAVAGDVTISRIGADESESIFDNLAGFFVADEANGTIDGVSPGASGYGTELIDRLVATGVSFDEDETPVTRTVDGGGFIVPFVVANGGGLSLSQVAALNPNNEAARELEDVVVYLPFTSANPDGANHFDNSRIGDNIFAFEDLPSNIATDNDFNDFVFQVTVA